MIGTEGALNLITTGKAARICGVGLNTIKSWIRSGHIRGIQLPSGHWRIPAVELDRFLATAEFNSGAKNRKPLQSVDSNGERPRVLVVDDDPQMHVFIEDACGVGGMDAEFVFSSDGYAGLIEIGRFKPHLLVLDIMMPEINGLELIQRIKKDVELARSMPVLVITGAQNRRLVMHRLEQAGPDAILHKPVAAPVLIETMRSLLEQCGSKGAAHAG
ncbi:excisionase [Mariprofundus ferrooxydans]|uniref:Excisionase/Xis, DNA-binding protein n=1 Tax=Mariprofundus ferrooxydans PV-1 TaxID=314345 RepID=Q0F2J7_9PROT|nr:Excisionase/Xis, DNA-binding protein [Mariprofundus ferrooxydans PV-1]KON48706.1 excisionase [Mariprofundus ferrooxydans]